MGQRLEWAIAGIASLFILKYGIVGLDLWDSWFHPGRREPGTLIEFRKPFLGLLQ